MTIQRIPPAPGQQSVWDYPRPPNLEECSRRIRVVFKGVTVADSTRTKRVLETSHPPVYYIPIDDIRMELLTATSRQSGCEWKGTAQYYTLRVGDEFVEDAAWGYPVPSPAFEGIRNHVAFYPGRVGSCYVDDEQVKPQPGGFYGGWITSDVVGPFKGDPGTMFW